MKVKAETSARKLEKKLGGELINESNSLKPKLSWFNITLLLGKNDKNRP